VSQWILLISARRLSICLWFLMCRCNVQLYNQGKLAEKPPILFLALGSAIGPNMSSPSEPIRPGSKKPTTACERSIISMIAITKALFHSSDAKNPAGTEILTR